MFLWCFSGDGPGAIKEINGWIAENTNQKIHDILSAGDILPLTKLVIVNAIYFKGDWSRKFDVKQTKEADFHVSSSESVKVQMMSMREATVAYGANQILNVKAIELPYTDGALSMFVLVPDHTVTTLHDLEASLTIEHLTNVHEAFHMYSNEVNIWLPRFKLDEKLPLNDRLTNMGMDRSV